MQKALSLFKEVTRNGGIALFHYGGHAVRIDGVNYLIPLNAKLDDKESVKYLCVDVDEVMNSLKGEANVVILDSCRDNPFTVNPHRGTKIRGLAAVPSSRNSIVVYSAGAGQTAQDGVFTPILTKLITQKNKTIEIVLSEVRSEVYQRTDGEQEPADYTKLRSAVYLASIDANTPAQKVEQTAAAFPSTKPPAQQAAASRPSAVVPAAVKKPAIKTGGGGDLTYSVNGINFKMKSIDAVIGDNNYNNNKEHKVSLSAYYIGETEVTQELWQAVMYSNPSSFKGSSKNPVECVNWYDCVTFCNELTAVVMGEEHCVYDIKGTSITADFSKTGFRLPTEAEWEYAAMGGKEYKYSGCNSKSQLKTYAWYGDNSENKTHEVGTKKANKYGLYDMSGNVWEWCWDWWSSSTPTGGKDPVGAVSGSSRVGRGGSWYYYTSICERAFRYHDNPSYGNCFLGLRLARRP